MIDVACAVVYNNLKQILLARRSKKRDIGKWEFPGGKVKSGESLEDAIQREILEELGILVKFKKHLRTIIKDKFRLHFVSCILISDTSSIVLKEHDKVKFVDLYLPLDLTLTSGDKEYFDEMIKEN